MQFLRNRYMIFCAAILFIVFSGALVAQQMGKFQAKSGGNEIWGQSGLTIRMKSGSTIDHESGSYLKIAGTSITSSAAELNVLAAVTPGTTSASKALVAGSSGELNALTITAPTLGTRLLTQTKIRNLPVGGMLTVTIANLDADDLVFGQMMAWDAEADSSIYIRRIVPGSGSAVVYLTATPTDSVTVAILSLQD